MNALSARRWVSPASYGTIYHDLGEKDQALAWLQKGCEKRSFEALFANVNPRFDDLRSDPRFAELLRCLKLAP